MDIENPEVITESVTDERDELIKAVEEAAPDLAESLEPKPAIKADGTPKVVNEEGKTPEEAQPPKARLAAILRAREERDKIREEIEEERKTRDQERRAQEYELHRMRAEAAVELEKAKSERARIEALRSRPIDAIKELGWDANNLVNEVTREGDPTWQAVKALREELAKERADREEKHKEYDRYVQENQRLAQEQQKQHAVYQRQEVERQFLSHAKPESSLRDLYDDEDLIAMGDNVANKFYEKTKKVASLEDIVEYLESRAEERLAARQQVAAKGAPKVRANGQRTLTSQLASERRATQKPIREMDPSEERAALMEAARDALRAG